MLSTGFFSAVGPVVFPAHAPGVVSSGRQQAVPADAANTLQLYATSSSNESILSQSALYIFLANLSVVKSEENRRLMSFSWDSGFCGASSRSARSC